MKFYGELAPVIFGVSIALIQPQIAVALSSSEVAKIAKAITVLINYQEGSGTGVIIKKEGDIYTVLTAAHVVATQAKYELVTPDGQRYPLNYSTVKKLPDVDLAVVQFTSSQNYPVAKIGNSDESPEGTTAYVAGFPKTGFFNTVYNFVPGQITANASKPQRDGYALAYNNLTLPGMSGGPVLNDKGELIGIHGRGEEANYETSTINPTVAQLKSGFNLGIPINTFLRLSAQSGVDVGIRPPSSSLATAPKADDFFIQGKDKSDKNNFQGAIADYTQAIRLNPNYANAYAHRGIAYFLSGDKKRAIEDANQAIKIDPKSADGYLFRASVHYSLGNKKEVLEDFTQYIKINPNDANVYYVRGLVRSDLGDKKGAIEDYNQALKINPNDANYIKRSNGRRELGDKKGAIEDYNQALKINPRNTNAYFYRGYVRYGLGDEQGAIEDYSQAIKINPNYALAYGIRAVVRRDLGDKQGAIADLQKAASLFLEQGDTNAYQKALEAIRKLQ
ncbi:tetratricopeptide repeat protein [Nostoc sp. TCL26-01]|nr:tetratricopeptide repeat protein [Nostoc sp. TCL26-01]